MKALSLPSGVVLIGACMSSANLVNIPASGKWDGIDGPWSTFSVRLGSSLREVRLLPSFFGASVAPIDANNCQGGSCPADSGLLYNSEASTTWESLLSSPAPALLGMSPSSWSYNASSLYGQDDLSIDIPDGSLRNLTKVSFVTPLFDLMRISTGMLGLSNRRISVGEIPMSSIITQLRQQNVTDSTSWFYTAGSSALNATGTLVLGGYDRTRIEPKSRLIVSQRNMTSSGNYYVYLNEIADVQGLLDRRTEVQLNSDTTQIWLSNGTCRNFEIAYGLVWNETHQCYLLDNDKHDELKRNNRSLKFTLQPNKGHPSFVEIEVPYHALDLQVKINGVNHYYFPIRPTKFTDKYVLGRAFFQAAYIMVNRDKNSYTSSVRVTLCLTSVADVRFRKHIVGSCESISRSRGKPA